MKNVIILMVCSIILGCTSPKASYNRTGIQDKYLATLTGVKGEYDEDLASAKINNIKRGRKSIISSGAWSHEEVKIEHGYYMVAVFCSSSGGKYTNYKDHIVHLEFEPIAGERYLVYCSYTLEKNKNILIHDRDIDYTAAIVKENEFELSMLEPLVKFKGEASNVK